MKVQNYMIVWAPERVGLSAMVRDIIRAGWVPQGGPFCTLDGTVGQAMVYPEPPESGQ